MSQESSKPSQNKDLIIRPEAGLANLPNGKSAALAEIINRSLVHIQTSKTLGVRHRIGEQELFGPDYRLVCAFAEDLRLMPEEVLSRLLVTGCGNKGWGTKVEEGRFMALHIDNKTLPISSIPSIDGLIVEILRVQLQALLSDLDFSMLPNLKVLGCGGNQLTKLDLSQNPNLRELACHGNRLTELDLSGTPNLTVLNCYGNQLSDLDLSAAPHLRKFYCYGNKLIKLALSDAPNLTDVSCAGNKLTELDLSGSSNLTHLSCYGNQLIVLDIRNLRNLETLKCDPATRLIQRPDQNFK